MRCLRHDPAGVFSGVRGAAWLIRAVRLCVALSLIATSVVSATDRAAVEFEVRQVLEQIPFAIEVVDQIESLGSCEQQARVMTFVTSLTIEQVAQHLNSMRSADSTQRWLSSRQQQLVWSSWWQGSRLVTAIVRPLAGAEAANRISGNSKGLLIISAPARMPANDLNLPSKDRSQPARAHHLASVVPGLSKELAGDEIFQHLLANGRLSCSREAEQTHWTLVAQVSIPLEQVRAHLAGLLSRQTREVRQLDGGGKPDRALLLVTGKHKQLLIGLFGTQTTTGVVIHSVDRSGAVSQVGQRAWAGQ